ncbi:MAG: hypothetical protein COA78_14335 [Blastopirellula sp.]|nr:MAG: hypothetical protein COA78_14335 [Blastopirellula sp.]
MDRDGFIMINSARVSFPHLFTRPTINGEEGKCGAALMLDLRTHKTAIKEIEDDIETLAAERFKKHKLPSDKRCLRDGDDKGRAEYEGFMILSANSKDRPVVIDAKGPGVITNEADSSIYAGCYVNVKIGLWAQDNKYGKRINAELVAIQFAGDGEALDGSYVSVDDAMSGFGTAANDNSDSEEDDFLAA